MRTMVRLAGLALLALLLTAPAAGASTLALSSDVVTYTGDPAADTVELSRYVDPRNGIPYYLVSDNGGITGSSPCFSVTSTLAACRVSTATKRHDVRSRGGAHPGPRRGPTPRGPPHPRPRDHPLPRP